MAKLVELNQNARNDGLQKTLFTVGVIGLFDFVANRFLPGGPRLATAAR